MRRVDIKDAAGLQMVLQEPAVLLYFFHDHCPPCRSLRPKIEQLLENQFPDMVLAYVDGFSHPEISAQKNVFGFPTLIGFFEGKEHFRKSKFVSIPEMSEAIGRPYRLLFSLG